MAIFQKLKALPILLLPMGAIFLGTVAIADIENNKRETPLVIAHRGASGYRPEHTLAAYELAIRQGADFIEPDLVATKDGVLIARHENELSGTTDVADRSEFAHLKTTKMIDGVETTGWFSEDFTLAEIKTLRAKERIPDIRPQNTSFDGQFEIPTLEEIIDLLQKEEKETGRKIGIYPETKHPTHFAKAGTLINGGSINTSLGKLLIDTLVKKNFTDSQRIFIQSFEFENLIELQNKIMPDAGVDLPLVQLYGDITDDFVQPSSNFSHPYDMIYNAEQGKDLRAIYGNLVDLVTITPTTGYKDLVNDDVISYIASNYAEGIGPWKNSFLLRETIAEKVDCNGDGVAEVGTQLTGEVEPFLETALKRGLEVHPYTLRAEERYLTLNTDGSCQNIITEVQQLLDLGVTGFFIDQPNFGRFGVKLYVRRNRRNR
ncbi:glycerophosphodiester phosphodiesterase family protein [Calothrix rhizosoleniae]|uniref:glycerophosphodiester phosphodiesterase family protein n=1 Tax=Calothrix rhizosoleniae TaxID=888997 RepID=UPI00190E9571|nr:glycerophosphodiester phosphodiesterase family protein [Calothrix rhizosoleniae]